MTLEVLPDTEQNQQGQEPYGDILTRLSEIETHIEEMRTVSQMPKAIGDANFAGTSPYFARADHKHKAKEIIETYRDDGTLDDVVNADTLDTYHAVAFPRKAEDAAVTGAWTISGNLTVSAVSLTDDMTVTAGKKVILRSSTEYLVSSDAGHVDIHAATSIDMNAAVSMTADVTWATDKKAIFRASANYIQSGAANELDIVAGSNIDLTATSVHLHATIAQVFGYLGVNITPGNERFDVSGGGHIRSHLYLNSQRDATLLTGNLRIESDSESEPVTDFLYDVSANSYGRTRKYQAVGWTPDNSAIALWTYDPVTINPSVHSIVVEATVVFVNTDDGSVGMEKVVGNFKYVGSTNALTEINAEETDIRSSFEDGNYTVSLEPDGGGGISLLVSSDDGAGGTDDCVWYGNIEVTEIIFTAHEGGGGGGC